MRPFAVVVLAAALSLPGLAFSQTENFVVEVQGVAPQLVGFAGSQANFQNLVNGLAQGTPITLVSLTPDGLEQTASFTPAGTMSSAQIAQTLESARQALISRGVAAPTPQQIAVTLLGGQLPTPAGSSAVAAMLPAATSASAGTSASALTGAASLQVNIRSAAPAVTTTTTGTLPLGSVPAPATTSTSPLVRNTSDSPFTTNTSNTPLPTAVPGANGQASPAAQIQQRH